jgi:ABC-type taurine transport system ATPase subunit
MLTKLTIQNFKRFERTEIELGNPVVFIGPNNSGKTTALQALALWEIGVRRWIEKRAGKSKIPENRPGVTINRRDLIAVPVPTANLLWHNLRTRLGVQKDGKAATENIRIDITVDGISDDKAWSCGLEFDYANEESFYCRPLRKSASGNSERLAVPDEAGKIRLAFLPPMSGLAAQEISLDPGAINVRIGEGRTAEVLRNLCYQIIKPINGIPDQEKRENSTHRWNRLVDHIKTLFGITLNEPQYISERGEIIMDYTDAGNVTFDLSASGRGLQQTLLLLAYMYANPGAVLLLDEPDAHLEILRQQQTYQLLTDVATSQGNQIIIATHSEVVLREAAGRDTVIAFVGKPHRINDRGSQVLKSLATIGFDQYYIAQEKGWVLYLEGSTDLAILQAFAQTLSHKSVHVLTRPFVHYVGNQISKAHEHFQGIREAEPSLRGICILDKQDGPLPTCAGLKELMWSRREIENYLCQPETLRAYARGTAPSDLFDLADSKKRVDLMDEIIGKLVPPVALKDDRDRWWSNMKASDELLDRVFEEYFKALALPNIMRKTNYHQFARLVPKELIDPEIVEKLDAVLAVAQAAGEKI